jgi:hypothetical protein
MVPSRRLVMKTIRLAELFPGVDLEGRELTPEEMAVVYRAARAAFTAEDLQRFTEPGDDDENAEDFLRELEETQRQYDQRTA